MDATRARAPAWRRPSAEPWQLTEQLLAFAAMLAIGTRLVVNSQVTVGYVLAIALLPLWLPGLRRHTGFHRLWATAWLAVVMGAALLVFSSTSHEINGSLAIYTSIEIVGVIACAGLAAWVIDRIGIAAAATAYGLGMLVSVNTSSTLYQGEPWRFGWEMPVTVTALGLVAVLKRPSLEFVTLLGLTAVSMLSGSRSIFGVQTLCVLILGYWLLRGRASWKRRSTLWSVLGLGAITVAIYSLGQALLLEGFLGENAQARSELQVRAAGSLILGGRPEIGATWALMRDHPLGFGPGTLPNWHDIQTASAGMWAIGYDPDNGYVYRWMFGSSFQLHSTVGDLWANFGLVGVVLALMIAWQSVQGIQRGPSHDGSDALFLYLAVRTLWNTFFAPWNSSIVVVTLLLALIWVRCRPTGATFLPPSVRTPWAAAVSPTAVPGPGPEDAARSVPAAAPRRPPAPRAARGPDG